MFSFLFKKSTPDLDSKPAESRRCPRVNPPTEEWRIVLRSFSGVRLTPKLLNASATGLCFQADRKQGELTHTDDRLTVEFFAPKQRTTITVTARLVWLYKHPRDDHYRGGIKFGRQPSETQREIITYLEKMLAAGGEVVPLKEHQPA